MVNSTDEENEDPEQKVNRENEKDALLRLLVWAYNRLEELEALEATEHVARAIEKLKEER